MKTEQGRSMVEMLGVLVIMGILTFAAFSGYRQAITKMQVNNTVKVVGMALQSLADIIYKNTSGLSITGTDAVQKALSTGLIGACDVLESEADEGYQVCEVPLGELYVKYEEKNSNQHSYMMHLMIIDSDEQACSSFLNSGWDVIIPKQWWKNAMIWLKSDLGEKVIFQTGGSPVGINTIAPACHSLCSGDNIYCMVVFDIAL